MKKNILNESFEIIGEFDIRCHDKYGNLKFVEKGHNRILKAGLIDIMKVYAGTSSVTTNYFFFTTAAHTATNIDTLATVLGVAPEFTGYTGNRPSYVFTVDETNMALTNISSLAVITIGSSSTLFGCGMAKNSTKGSTSGDGFCYKNFSSSRPVENGDTLSISYVITFISA